MPMNGSLANLVRLTFFVVGAVSIFYLTSSKRFYIFWPFLRMMSGRGGPGHAFALIRLLATRAFCHTRALLWATARPQSLTPARLELDRVRFRDIVLPNEGVRQVANRQIANANTPKMA